ncbi:MAG TPA: hypothetical protein VE991_11755 [Acidimicrobiales bacterium]|nr:hypothetical protein [Acidimicrobiales bacterium]
MANAQVTVGKPLVFNHIPKTAGTALIAALIEALKPVAPFHGYSRSALGAFATYDKLSPAARRGLVVTPADIPEGADAVFGHIPPSPTRARFESLNQLTVLREPRTRLVSHWLFSRAHTDSMLRGWSGWGDYVRRARLPLAAYLADADVAFISDNLITRFLVWPDERAPMDGFIDPRFDDELFEAAVASLKRFDFVAVTEDGTFTEQLSAWLGRELRLLRVNESPPMPRGLQCDVAAECDAAASLIEERSRIDARLWDELARRTYLAHRPGETATERDRAFDDAVRRYETIPVAGRLAAPLSRARSVAAAARHRGRRHVGA